MRWFVERLIEFGFGIVFAVADRSSKTEIHREWAKSHRRCHYPVSVDGCHLDSLGKTNITDSSIAGKRKSFHPQTSFQLTPTKTTPMTMLVSTRSKCLCMPSALMILLQFTNYAFRLITVAFPLFCVFIAVFSLFCFCFFSLSLFLSRFSSTTGSIIMYQSLNSLATSLATSLAISTHSFSSNDSDKSTEVTRL